MLIVINPAEHNSIWTAATLLPVSAAKLPDCAQTIVRPTVVSIRSPKNDLPHPDVSTPEKFE